LRSGATGKERIRVVKSLYRLLNEFLMPPYMRYIIYISTLG